MTTSDRYMRDTIGVPTGEIKVNRAMHPNRQVGRDAMKRKKKNLPSTGSIVDIPTVGPAQVTESGKRYFKSETVSSRRPIGPTGVGIVRDERLA